MTSMVSSLGLLRLCNHEKHMSSSDTVRVLFLFQAEYEVTPDEKLGEKGKEIMTKYLTPKVRGCPNPTARGKGRSFRGIWALDPCQAMWGAVKHM